MRSRKGERTNVARRELIGLQVAVEGGHKGIEGVVVDETKHTILVETPSGEKRVPKKGNRFVFRVGTDAVVVDGKDITFQPEDRTKKVRG